MDFFLKPEEMDLGDTPIENIFINNFMPMADGTCVKVYILGYKCAYDKDENIEVNNETIAKHLDIPLADVLRAWDFWEEKGIIEKIKADEEDKYNYKVKFLNLKELYIKNNYTQITVSSVGNKRADYYSCGVKDVLEANTSPIIQNMFKEIEYVFRRPLFPEEKRKILDWMYNYNLNPDIVVKAFFYSVEIKGNKNIYGVERIIKKWSSMGVINVESLMNYLEKKGERMYAYEKVLKSLGVVGRVITDGERKIVDRWFDEYHFTIEMILKACENSSKTTNPSVNYIQGILSSWYSKGIKTVEDIEKKDKPAEKKEYKKDYQKQKDYKVTKTRFHNFEQRSDKYTAKQLEEMARKKREGYYLKSKGD